MFLLIGLQARTIIADVGSEDVTLRPDRRLICAAVLVGGDRAPAGVGLRRPLPAGPAGARRGDRRRRRGPTPSCSAGRACAGVVTLAAAFVIPPGTPHRDVLLLIAFTVTAGTLFLQGLTLPWLARRLRVPSPDPARRRPGPRQPAAPGVAGRARRARGARGGRTRTASRAQIRRPGAASQQRRLGALGASDDETPSEVYARSARAMIDAERARVLEVRNTGTVAHEVVDEVLAMLDVEESMLDYCDRERERVRAAQPRCTLEGDCEHLREVRPPVEPDTPGECATACARARPGCTCGCASVCGHIACCDSSPERHASAHYRETGHEVMRSAEPGENWRWCFVDQLTG